MDSGSLYFTILTLALGAGFLWFIRTGERRGLPRQRLVDVCLVCLVFGLLGARLLYAVSEPLPDYPLSPGVAAEVRLGLARLTDAERVLALGALGEAGPVPAVWRFAIDMPPGPSRLALVEAAAEDPGAVPSRYWFWTRPWRVLYVWQGGLVFLGGLVGATLAAIVACWLFGLPVGETADVAAPALQLGSGLGRIACLVNGCCYGATCVPGWFSDPPLWWHPEAEVARYPTALLLSLFSFALFGALVWRLPRRRFPGEVFVLMLFAYALGRGGIEELRGDARGSWVGFLSTSQAGSGALAVIALLIWVWLGSNRPRQPPLTPEEVGGGVQLGPSTSGLDP